MLQVAITQLLATSTPCSRLTRLLAVLPVESRGTDAGSVLRVAHGVVLAVATFRAVLAEESLVAWPVTTCAQPSRGADTATSVW